MKAEGRIGNSSYADGLSLGKLISIA